MRPQQTTMSRLRIFRWPMLSVIRSMGKTAEKLIAKLMPGGLYASVVGARRDAGNYSAVKVVAVVATPDRKTLELMAKAVRDGELVIPISRKLPLSKVGEAQAAAEEGGTGKVLLVADVILQTEDTKGKSEMKKRVHAESTPLRSRWVCRMPSVTERLVVSSPSVCEVWAHRLLRQFSEPACVQACGDNRASDHCQLRAG